MQRSSPRTSPRQSPRSAPNAVLGGLTLPAHVKHLWRTNGGTLRTLRGPLHATSYTGAFVMEDGSSKSIPVDATKGLWVGPGYSNLFTGGPTGAEVKTLTAQKYCLQCVGGSVDAGAYGTATPSSPLVFTASAGNQTFTPTGCTAWMLSAAGGYVFPYVPPGTTQPSAIGTSGGNGASWPLTGSDKADRLIECFRGVPDGVEKIPVGSTILMRKGDFVISGEDGTHIITDVASGVRYQSDTTSPVLAIDKTGILTVGARYRFVIKQSSWVSGSIKIAGFGDYVVPVGNATTVVELTATQTSLYLIRNSANVDLVIDFMSIQKLNPATFTIAALCYMGAENAEITADANVISVRNVVAGVMYFASGGTIKASDGTNTATVTVSGGWARGDKLAIFERTSADGSQFQIGYEKNLSGTITWGSLATFKGSHTPGTALRIAYNGVHPLHVYGVETSVSVKDDSGCLAMRGGIQ